MKFFKGFIICIFLLVGVGLAQAHPAHKVEMKFDNQNKMLHLSFSHKVRDAADHFIYEVKIELNGEEIIEQKLSLQENGDGGNFIYKIPEAKIGDTIKVVTDCNKGGKKAGELEIQAPPEKIEKKEAGK